MDFGVHGGHHERAPPVPPLEELSGRVQDVPADDLHRLCFLVAEFIAVERLSEGGLAAADGADEYDPFHQLWVISMGVKPIWSHRTCRTACMDSSTEATSP